MFTNEQITAMIKAIVSGFGAFFVGKGIIDADTLSAVGGASAMVAVGVLHYMQVKKAAAVVVTTVTTTDTTTAPAPAPADKPK
jgi:hypothetical protein